MILFVLYQLLLLGAVALLYAFVKLLRARKYRFLAKNVPPTTDINHLPSVSVCIPARNEMNALNECLESVLASDYPKMEVLVLDDNSSDNTSQIIRAFAHAGVRFVQGQPLPDGWLGKNYTLHQLSREASGSLILFMDVDTRIQPHTISKIVHELEHKKLSMLSVVPQRADTTRASVWFASLRYFWMMVFHSQMTPAAASALWMIRRHDLERISSDFEMYRTVIQPEQSIAQAISRDGGYQFFISTKNLGATYEKKWASQRRTAQRILYPFFQQSALRMSVGAGLTAGMLGVIFSAAYFFIDNNPFLLYSFVALILSYLIVHVLFCSLLWQSRWIFSFLAAPIVAVQELLFYYGSAWGYHQGTITWKNRVIGPVSLPTEAQSETSSRD